VLGLVKRQGRRTGQAAGMLSEPGPRLANRSRQIRNLGRPET
jgi:hypothetical protein